MNQPADARLYSGAIDCFVKLIKKDGVKGLYAGTYSVLLCCAMLYCIVLYCTVLYCTTLFVHHVILSLNMSARVTLNVQKYVQWQMYATHRVIFKFKFHQLLNTICFFITDSSSSFLPLFSFRIYSNLGAFRTNNMSPTCHLRANQTNLWCYRQWRVDGFYWLVLNNGKERRERKRERRKDTTDSIMLCYASPSHHNTVMNF